MSVHQLEDGRWFVKIYDPSKPSKSRREYFGRGAGAEIKARNRDQELDFKRTKPRADDDSGPLFHELATEYLLNKNFNDNSLKLCTLRLEKIIIPVIGQIPAIRLTYDDLDKYVRKRRQTVKANTVRREVVDIKAILNWAVKRRPPMLSMNPIRDYQPPPADDDIITPPTISEVEAILKYANDRLYRAIKIAWYTGLRPGAVELFSLRWNSVLWDIGLLRITSADKGGLRIRDVPIHPDFVEELRSWTNKDNDPAGYIIHHKGQPITSLKVAWKYAKEKANITRRLRLYDLRHFFVTTAIESGSDYKTLSTIVGSSPETLRRHYQHVSGAAKVSLIERMPNLKTPS
jgi:integrase